MQKAFRVGSLLAAMLLLIVAVGYAGNSDKAVDLADNYLKGKGKDAVKIGADEKLALRSASDDGTGLVHVRYNTTWKNTRLWGSEVIVHVNPGKGKVEKITSEYKQKAHGRYRPEIPQDEAVATVQYMMNLTGAADTKVELVQYPVGNEYALAWVIDVFAEGEETGPKAMVYVMDATSGAILDQWNNLQYYTPGTGTAATGTGKPLYLVASPATLSLNTEKYSATAYGLVDRLSGNSYTTNMKNKTNGSGTLFTDADNVWGNYLSSDTASAAVDAHLGMTLTFNYYKNVHGRNGIFNDGKGVYSRVHYGRRYNNAFWSDSCKCMTYGDGDGTTLLPLVSLDVAAHEMSHGVCAATADLVYSGQSGALNESNSDIFAACVEFYADSPKDTPDWMIGEMIYTPKKAGDALRYMDDPGKDGYSIDHYSDYTSSLDVHYSSGLANNWFYLLAQGGTNKTSGIAVSGIGIAKAERIWYVALTGYMTSTCSFAGARTATINAATQLYGASSTEVQRVKDAWTACGVN